MYKQALKEGIQITTRKGLLSIQQLFTVDTETLILCEEELQGEVEAVGKTQRRKRAARTKSESLLELKLSIVSDILDDREKEESEAKDEALRKANNQKIAEIIARKKEGELEGKSIEELEALLK